MRFGNPSFTTVALVCMASLSDGALAAASKPEFVERLGGSFVDLVASPGFDSKAALPEANYFTEAPAPAGYSGSPTSMLVAVYGAASVASSGGAEKFYGFIVKSYSAQAQLSPAAIPGAQQCVSGRPAGSNSEMWLCLANGMVLSLLTSPGTHGGKIDGAAKAARLVGLMNGSGGAVGGDLNSIADVLIELRPGLFRGLPREALLGALAAKEKSLTGGAGATESLRRMAKKIAALREFVLRPLPEPQALVAGASAPAPKRLSELIFDLLDDHGDLFLPEIAQTLVGWAAFYKNSHEAMTSVRDAMFIPALAQDLYSTYAKARLSAGKDGAYDLLQGRLAPVRAAPEFVKMDTAQFQRVFMARLEARWQWQRLESARQALERDMQGTLRRAAMKWEDKMGVIHEEALRRSGTK